MNNSNLPILIILNRVRQYGLNSHKYYDFLGVYSSMNEATKQMNYHNKMNPSTEDNPFYYEIIQSPINHIGENNYQIKRLI